MQKTYTVQPFTSTINGEAILPGSKSITNRALLISALADGIVTLQNPLLSDDTLIMIEILERLGFNITKNKENDTISVQGLNGEIPNSTATFDVGNAGTAARFIPAFVALRKDGYYHFDGSPAMRERPIKGLLDALENLNAIATDYHEKPGHFPFSIKTQGINGGSTSIDAHSTSQFISALLIAGSKTNPPISITPNTTPVSQPYIEMTKQMLSDIKPNTNYFIEPDTTAASYFLGLTAIIGGSLSIPNFPFPKSLQGDTEFLNLLKLPHQYKNKTLHISTAKIDIGGHYDMTHISDTFITLAAMAPLSNKTTHITGIKHTRGKETNRIQAVADELSKLGQTITTTEDSITITPQPLKSNIEIETYEDHRMAMAFAMLGSYDLHKNGQPWIKIQNPSCCKKTFPHYFNTLEQLRYDSHH